MRIGCHQNKIETAHKKAKAESCVLVVMFVICVLGFNLTVADKLRPTVYLDGFAEE
jgi:hypothetical protein